MVTARYPDKVEITVRFRAVRWGGSAESRKLLHTASEDLPATSFSFWS